QHVPWVRGAVDRPRLWRPRGLFDKLASPEMATAMSSALECSGDAGVQVQDSGDTGLLETRLEPVLRDHHVILASEAAATHRGLDCANPPAYPARIDELL